MITAIGLFTESGDIKPNVLNILEEQRKARPHDRKNQQFRNKRQWDVQINLKSKAQINPL